MMHPALERAPESVQAFAIGEEATAARTHVFAIGTVSNHAARNLCNLAEIAERGVATRRSAG
jgi:hypothetical protein